MTDNHDVSRRALHQCDVESFICSVCGMPSHTCECDDHEQDDVIECQTDELAARRVTGHECLHGDYNCGE